MSRWRTGKFDKQRIHRVFHKLTPASAVNSLVEIDLQELWDAGKRLLLVDVDNTLVQWRQESFSPPVIAWIERAKSMGFEICLVSNTYRPERLSRLREILGVESVMGRFKPSRAMFRLGMIKFNRKQEETIMIGDQLMTDIFGANRAGIDAIWVKKMEGTEFGPTGINRRLERFFQGFIYKALVAPLDETQASPEVEQAKPLPDRTIVHQLIRFCLVGGSSFAINYMIRMTLLFAVPWQGGLFADAAGNWLKTNLPLFFGGAATPSDAFFPVAAGIAACFAILNSFIWNRFWTFEIRGSQGRFKQLRRFVVVSLIGAGFDVLLSTVFNSVLPFDPKWNARVATVLSAGLVAVWNFAGQRYYAFRSKKPAVS